MPATDTRLKISVLLSAGSRSSAEMPNGVHFSKPDSLYVLKNIAW